MIPQEIIRRKRHAETLTEEEIRWFVTGVCNGTVSNEQIAALTMAIWFQGLGIEEQSHLTLAIRDSGTILEWPGLDGPVLDKHSTGGVGDMVSFTVAPLVAACGGFVPMISGRGLGHTGGTLDKLESLPGIKVLPDIETFQSWVRKRGLAIVGQTADLAPADRHFYAVRDATATVDSIPLIVSSILGKKLCEGLDGLVMDIKVGNGAFMPDAKTGHGLAEDICEVARASGLPCAAIFSDMNQPLVASAGNALEVREAIGYLGGDHRHPRLHEVASAVAAEMLVVGGLAASFDAAHHMVEKALESGAAAAKFEDMVAGQGGPRVALDRLAETLPSAPISRAVHPERPGYVAGIDTRALGLAVVLLGGGRLHPEDRIDHSVGLGEIAVPGDAVGADRPLAVIHARDESTWQKASAKVLSAFTLAAEATAVSEPVILGRYTKTLEGND